MPTRPIRLLAVVALFAALAPARVPAAESPREIVQKLSDAVLAVLGDKSLPSDEKRHRIEGIVYGSVDFETLSRLVLARNWSRFTPEQQAAFIEEFKKHLALTYGKNVESYKNERVAIDSDREEANHDWTVKTRILRGGSDDIRMDYRLRQTNGQWKIIDFIIEQVSLVANYRSQFQDILSGGTPEKLLQLLRDKNARGEPLKAPHA